MLNQSVSGGGSVKRNENHVQGVVKVQGMCPHEFYLGTCTCIKIIKARGGCVGVKYGGCEGARDVST